MELKVKPYEPTPKDKPESQTEATVAAVIAALSKLGVLTSTPPAAAAPDMTPVAPDITLVDAATKKKWLEQTQPSACRCDDCVNIYHVNLTKGRLSGKGLHWRCAGCGTQRPIKERPAVVSVKVSRDAKDPVGYHFCSAACGTQAPRAGETLNYDSSGRPTLVGL